MQILALLTEHGQLGQNQLVKMVAGRTSDVTDLLKTMANEGSIGHSPGPNRSIVYSRNGDSNE